MNDLLQDDRATEEEKCCKGCGAYFPKPHDLADRECVQCIMKNEDYDALFKPEGQ